MTRLQGGTRRSTSVGAAAIIFALFLIFLGIRVPDISSHHSPKPRPRAIVEHLVKVAPTVFKDSWAPSFEPTSAAVVPAPIITDRSAEPFCDHTLCCTVEVQYHAARAPPQPSIPFGYAFVPYGTEPYSIPLHGRLTVAAI